MEKDYFKMDGGGGGGAMYLPFHFITIPRLLEVESPQYETYSVCSTSAISNLKKRTEMNCRGESSFTWNKLEKLIELFNGHFMHLQLFMQNVTKSIKKFRISLSSPLNSFIEMTWILKIIAMICFIKCKELMHP